MGYMRHHSIVVTGSDYPVGKEAVLRAHFMAEQLFPQRVSPLIETRTNGYLSFFVAPDGSKEGWAESDEGDEARAKFIKFMDTQRYQDGSSLLDWVEIQYGDDDQETKIASHSDEEQRRKPGILA